MAYVSVCVSVCVCVCVCVLCVYVYVRDMLALTTMIGKLWKF